jgi:hypothetical protein
VSSAAEVEGRWSEAPWRRHATALSLCAVLLLTGLRPGTGFLALLLAPLIALWFLVQIIQALRRRWPWRNAAVNAAAIAATALVLVAAHAVFEQWARQAADEARQAVLDYHATHGAWPRTLAETGHDDPDRDKTWRVTYLTEGKFAYSSTLDPFDRWYRGPDDVDWTFRPD